MKVLFVTHHYLDSNGGGSFASRAYINAFAEIADECCLIYPDNGNDISQFIQKKIIFKGIRSDQNKIRKFIDIYKGHINRFEGELIPVTVSFQPNIVVFDNSRSSAGLIKNIKKLGIKIITIHHNYEIEYYKDIKTLYFLLWRIPFLYHLRKSEQDAVQLSDINLTITLEDKELLKSHYDKKKNAIFEHIGCYESRPSTIELPQNIKIDLRLCFIITGSLDAYQTQSSLMIFFKDYFPLLLRKVPDCKIIIAGKKPSATIRDICMNYPNSVTLVSTPPDIQEIIAQADIYICPVSMGGGLKLRIMDGLKAGLPILTHTVSSRGYDKFKEEGCLFEYKDKKSFENSLDSILAKVKTDNFHKKDIQMLYQKTFSFTNGVENLRKILIANNLLKYKT